MISTETTSYCTQYSVCEPKKSKSDCDSDECEWIAGEGQGMDGYCQYKTATESFPECYGDFQGNAYDKNTCTEGARGGQDRETSCMWVQSSEELCVKYKSDKPEPTPKPTPQPTKPAPPPPTAENGCPKNCGDGTCDENQQCKSCSEGRLLAKGKVDGVYFGKCVGQLNCKKREVLSGSLSGKPCKCLDKHCHYCQRGPNGDVCKRCRDNKYLLNGECVDSCPEGMTHSGTGGWGRVCAEPFTCKGGRVIGAATSTGCKCAKMGKDGMPSGRAPCHICEFEADQYGQKCTRCNGGTYLNKDTNTCDEDCGDQEGILSYRVGLYGGECRTPFTCTGKKDEQGNKCKCPNEVGKNDCEVCEWRLDDVSCLRCTNNRYLNKKTGKCGKKCPAGTTMQGTAKSGRECV